MKRVIILLLMTTSAQSAQIPHGCPSFELYRAAFSSQYKNYMREFETIRSLTQPELNLEKRRVCADFNGFALLLKSIYIQVSICIDKGVKEMREISSYLAKEVELRKENARKLGC